MSQENKRKKRPRQTADYDQPNGHAENEEDDEKRKGGVKRGRVEDDGE